MIGSRKIVFAHQACCDFFVQGELSEVVSGDRVHSVFVGRQDLNERVFDSACFFVRQLFDLHFAFGPAVHCLQGSTFSYSYDQIAFEVSMPFSFFHFARLLTDVDPIGDCGTFDFTLLVLFSSASLVPQLAKEFSSLFSVCMNVFVEGRYTRHFCRNVLLLGSPND